MEWTNKIPSQYYMPLAVGFLVGISIGWFGSSLTIQTTPDSASISNTNQQSPLLANKTAAIQGKITKVDSASLTIVDNKNQTETFPVSNKFIVYVPVKNTRTATASADVNMVEINRQALVTLELIDGTYRIVSISYLP